MSNLNYIVLYDVVVFDIMLMYCYFVHLCTFVLYCTIKLNCNIVLLYYTGKKT